MCSRPCWLPCWLIRKRPASEATTDALGGGRQPTPPGEHWGHGSCVLPVIVSSRPTAPSGQDLTSAQQQLYDWLVQYIQQHRHSPSIRQMMEAMGLRSPAPIQSRLRHLQQKGWVTWQEGQARSLPLLGPSGTGVIPVLGSVAPGGLIESFDDVRERLRLPVVPVADHGDRAGVRRPHREPGRRPHLGRDSDHLRTEQLPETPVRSLTEQMEVELTDM